MNIVYKRIKMSKTIDCMCWKYYWKYNLYCLVSWQKTILSKVYAYHLATISWTNFFWSKNKNNIVSSLDLLRALFLIDVEIWKRIYYFCRFWFLIFLEVENGALSGKGYTGTEVKKYNKSGRKLKINKNQMVTQSL